MKVPGQSPTAWRLLSCLGPEICEREQRQIRQLDHRRLRVTRQSLPHLPETATLRNSSSRRQHFINASSVLLSRWVGYFPEVTRSGPRGIPPFSWLCHSRHATTGSFNFINPDHSDDLEGVSPHQLHYTHDGPPCSVKASGNAWEMGQSPFGLTFGFAHSGHSTSGPIHPFYAELVLMRR